MGFAPTSLSSSTNIVMEKPQPSVTSWTKGVFAAGFYVICSVLMTICNKWVVSTWDFGFNSFILLGQMLFSFAVLEVMRRGGRVEVRPLASGDLRMLIPLVGLYLGNVGAALTALRLTSVPVYNVLKRAVPFPVMLGDWWVRNQQFSVPVQGSVAVIMLGALITGSGDLDFDLNGYTLAILSCALQAGYLVFTSKAHDHGYKSDSILYYTAVLSIPLLVFITVLSELRGLASYDHWGSPMFLLCLLACCGMGSLLNYALFLCCTTNSALTTVVCGQVKAILSTAFGFFLFGKVNLTLIGAAGMLLNTSGGALYAWAKFSEGPREKGAEPRPERTGPQLTPTKCAVAA